jgi:hypothetical protein
MQYSISSVPNGMELCAPNHKYEFPTESVTLMKPVVPGWTHGRQTAPQLVFARASIKRSRATTPIHAVKEQTPWGGRTPTQPMGGRLVPRSSHHQSVPQTRTGGGPKHLATPRAGHARSPSPQKITVALHSFTLHAALGERLRRHYEPVSKHLAASVVLCSPHTRWTSVRFRNE